MRCNIEGCSGEYEQREVVHTVRQGNRILVIDHVPAEVCTVCGDVLFTPETMRKYDYPKASDRLRLLREAVQIFAQEFIA